MICNISARSLEELSHFSLTHTHTIVLLQSGKLHAFIFSCWLSSSSNSLVVASGEQAIRESIVAHTWISPHHTKRKLEIWAASSHNFVVAVVVVVVVVVVVIVSWNYGEGGGGIREAAGSEGLQGPGSGFTSRCRWVGAVVVVPSRDCGIRGYAVVSVHHHGDCDRGKSQRGL